MSSEPRAESCEPRAVSCAQIQFNGITFASYTILICYEIISLTVFLFSCLFSVFLFFSFLSFFVLFNLMNEKSNERFLAAPIPPAAFHFSLNPPPSLDMVDCLGHNSSCNILERSAPTHA